MRYVTKGSLLEEAIDASENFQEARKEIDACFENINDGEYQITHELMLSMCRAAFASGMMAVTRDETLVAKIEALGYKVRPRGFDL